MSNRHHRFISLLALLVAHEHAHEHAPTPLILVHAKLFALSKRCERWWPWSAQLISAWLDWIAFQA